MLGLIEELNNLISRHGNRRSACDAPFDGDPARLAASWNATFDVVAKPLGLAIHWIVAKTAFDLHDHRAGVRRYRVRVR